MIKNILLVENDVTHQTIIKEHLEQNLENIRIFIVSNTTDAEVQLSKIPIDLIVLDHGLPDKTGLDWYNEYISLQKDQLIRNIPILFVTVYGMIEEIKRLASTEKNIILIDKPFRTKDLLAAAKRLLKL